MKSEIWKMATDLVDMRYDHKDIEKLGDTKYFIQNINYILMCIEELAEDIEYKLEAQYEEV
jgi:hypothetical protein